MPVVPVGDSQTFIWFTKHENIADNNKADLLVKAGTTENSIEIVHEIDVPSRRANKLSHKTYIHC